MKQNKKFLYLGSTALSLWVMFSIFRVAHAVAVPDEIRIAPNESWSQEVPATSVLSIIGRIDYDKPAGANYPLEIYVNDQSVTSPLTNKSASFTYKDGRTFPYLLGKAWMLFYSADLSANNSTSGGGYQVMTELGQAYIYKWNISSLVGSAASMKLRLVNNGKSIGKPIVIKVVSTYPIVALANCTSKEDCKSFCDSKANITACVNFAEKNGMMSKDDAAQARKFSKMGDGPGGCKSQGECESYCNDVAHLDQCLDFASKNGLVDAKELGEAKKVAEVLKAGGKLPGGCKNKSECESFCNDLDNAEECFNFAEKAGFIPKEELADAKKAMEAMKNGAKPPGGCKNKKECDNFCSDSANIEECLGFAEKAGFIPKEEIEQARKIIPLMKAGKMPGGCKDKAGCDSYCKDDAHVEECGNFAIEAGFMKPEEAEMFKKTGGKGPGGCKGKGECESFCNDPANQEQCFKFASDKGLIPEEKVKEMKEGMAQFQQGLGMATPEVLECIKNSVGADRFEKMKSGGIPDKSVGEAMGQCFAKLMKGPGGAGGPPAGFEGGAPEGFDGKNGPPSAEDIQKMIPKGVNVSPEMLKKGPPSAEDIQKMLPKGVEVTPEMMKNGPPSQEQIQNMIQQKVKEQMEKSGPSGSGQSAPSNGSFGPPAGTNFGPPAGIPVGPPAGF